MHRPAPAGRCLFPSAMFQHKYRYIFISVLAVFTFLNTVLCEVYHYFHINIEWYYSLLTILLVTLLTWEGNRLIQPILLRMFPPARKRNTYLVSFFVSGSVISFAGTIVTVAMVGSVLHDYSWNQLMVPLKLNIIYAGLVNLLLHLLNTIIFFFHEYRKKWEEAEELRRNSEEAQLQLIKNQINPHFLFNNLNVLSSLVIKTNPEANEFIEEFSKVYRYILNNQDKELIDLNTELEFIKPYIFLLKKRFDNGLEIALDIPDEYKRSYVIPVALQMLIENAIKHNIVSKAKPLLIKVAVDQDHSLIVKNNLQPRQNAEPGNRIGLQNIQKRYELISGKKIDVRHTDSEFVVSLPLLHLN